MCLHNRPNRKWQCSRRDYGGAACDDDLSLGILGSGGGRLQGERDWDNELEKDRDEATARD